ncbi:MAG: NADH-quinone oxidoreductase subunit N, partial [Acidimicrobiia bacterium]|nr:NADH-quinone oxidoreductase subunit N [Acidimicrobiia bacterium]
MTLDYHALAPEIILAITVMAVLVIDLLPVEKYWAAVAGLFGLFLAVIPLLTLGFCESLDFCTADARVMLDGGYVVDTYSLVLKGLFIVGAFIALLLSVGYLEADRFWEGEFYFLLLASVLGAVAMASSRDLITIFVSLELVTGPTFLMAGWRKGDTRSNEAAIKFFLIGVISAAILLFGMSLVYGMTGEITFEGIRVAAGAVDSPLMTVGVLFVLLGFAFKVSAVPFHFWTPDTYQGAPTPATAYLSVGSKAAGFVGLLSMTYLAFGDLADLWGPFLWILAAASMTVGNIIALRQTNLVRLLGFSSIAQAGFMLVPFGAAAAANGEQLETAFFATVAYLLIYAVMNLGAFAVVIAVSKRIGSAEIDDWRGLFGYAPGMAALLAVFFFSLAGIPPLGGWFAKFVVFRSAISVGGGWGNSIAVIAVINAVIAFFYYARVVKAAWMDRAPADVDAGDIEPVPSLRLAL